MVKLMIAKTGKNLINKLVRSAERSPKKRAVIVIHRDKDNMQMFLNCILKDSKIEIHKHEYPDKTEVFNVVKGFIKLQEFDDKGNIIRDDLICAGGIGFIRPGVYHSIKVLSEYAVIFICIDGKYDPKTHHKLLKIKEECSICSNNENEAADSLNCPDSNCINHIE